MASPSSVPPKRNTETLGSIQMMQDFLDSLSSEFEQRYQDVQSHIGMLAKQEEQEEEEDTGDSVQQTSQNGALNSEMSSKAGKSGAVFNDLFGENKEGQMVSITEQSQKQKPATKYGIVTILDKLSKGEIVRRCSFFLKKNCFFGF